jgi:hypothetical protein
MTASMLTSFPLSLAHPIDRQAATAVLNDGLNVFDQAHRHAHRYRMASRWGMPAPANDNLPLFNKRKSGSMSALPQSVQAIREVGLTLE